MSEPMTYWQAESLAKFIHEAIRPDWGVGGIVSALQDARQMGDPSDVAIAAIVAARTAANRTPAVLPLPGPHWAHTALQKRPSAHTTPPRSRTCGTCYMDYNVCRSRWAHDHEFESLDDVRKRRTAAADENRPRPPINLTAKYLDGRPVKDVNLP